MLKPAQLYKESLMEEHIKSWHNLEYKFYSGGTGDFTIELPDNTYDSHCFVSVDSDDNVIGYISYSVDWTAMTATNFGFINYHKGDLKKSFIFLEDAYKAIFDLFNVYHMNRIGWWCYADNPAIRGYRNFIKRCGGRECGYHRQVAKLQDGKLHDSVDFEILASEFAPPERSGGGTKKSKTVVKPQFKLEEKTVRRKIDYGKIMALHNAGWSNAKIADEMDMSKESVAVAICNYKKKLKERGNEQ